MEKTNFKIITSWDDGARQDLGIAELLLKYGLPGIFYIPTKYIYKGLTDKDIKEIDRMGFTIGGHTETHPEDLKDLNITQLRNEIRNNKNYLEKLIGKKVKSFAYPSGRYNDEVLKEVQAAGYEEARTTVMGSFIHPEDPFRIKITVQANPDRRDFLGVWWLNYAKKIFKDAQSIGGYFHLLGHSWEIDKYQLWEDLEELFKFIKENK